MDFPVADALITSLCHDTLAKLLPMDQVVRVVAACLGHEAIITDITVMALMATIAACTEDAADAVAVAT